jgi:gas vesicle protein
LTRCSASSYRLSTSPRASSATSSSLQKAVDVNRELATNWADAVNSFSGVVREQTEKVREPTTEQADKVESATREQVDKVEQAEKTQARRPRQATTVTSTCTTTSTTSV